jgi:hypothetical protein
MSAIKSVIFLIVWAVLMARLVIKNGWQDAN